MSYRTMGRRRYINPYGIFKLGHERAQQLIIKSNILIVFTAALQTSFKHSKIAFFKT